MTIERAAPLLMLRRSNQSGSKTLTGAYATVFEDHDNLPWIFTGAWIDLTNMGAGIQLRRDFCRSPILTRLSASSGASSAPMLKSWPTWSPGRRHPPLPYLR